MAGIVYLHEKLQMAILAAISLAQEQMLIPTPDFLPDESMIAALNVAAMLDVQVRILIPERNNIRLVQWASIALLPQVLERGCAVCLTPPPFDHSKLLLIDHHWSLIGSTNWDPRSLRLNFEFHVECYGGDLNQQLAAIFEQKLPGARAITGEELRRRHLWLRLRDGIARLASPDLSRPANSGDVVAVADGEQRCRTAADSANGGGAQTD